MAEAGDHPLLRQVLLDGAGGRVLLGEAFPLQQVVRFVDHLRRRARRAGDGAVGEDASRHAGDGRLRVRRGHEPRRAGGRADELLVHRYLQRELPDGGLLLRGQLAAQEQPRRFRVGELLHDLLQRVAAHPYAASLGAADAGRPVVAPVAALHELAYGASASLRSQRLHSLPGRDYQPYRVALSALQHLQGPVGLRQRQPGADRPAQVQSARTHQVDHIV